MTPSTRGVAPEAAGVPLATAGGGTGGRPGEGLPVVGDGIVGGGTARTSIGGYRVVCREVLKSWRLLWGWLTNRHLQEAIINSLLPNDTVSHPRS